MKARIQKAHRRDVPSNAKLFFEPTHIKDYARPLLQPKTKKSFFKKPLSAPSNTIAATSEIPGTHQDLQAPRFARDPKLEAAYDNQHLIKNGALGEHVMKIQQALVDDGHALPAFGVDGIFGSETKQAIQHYQSTYQLLVDGIIGPETMGHLDRKYMVQPAKPAPPEPVDFCSLFDQNQSGEETGTQAQSFVPARSTDQAEGAFQMQNMLLNTCGTKISCLKGPLPSNTTGPLVSVGHVLKPKPNVVAEDLDKDPTGKIHFCPKPDDRLKATGIETANGSSVQTISSGKNGWIKFRVCDGPNNGKHGKIQQRFVDNPIKGVFNPVDLFKGRSFDYVGVGEEVNLTNNSIFCGANGIKWEMQKGTKAQLSGVTESGTASFQAHEHAEEVQLVLRDKESGVALDQKNFEILVPDNTSYLTQVPGTNVKHRKGLPSAGFVAHLYLKPEFVSFKFLEFREQSAPVDKHGYWADAPPSKVGAHSVGDWKGFEGGDASVGTKFKGGDEAFSSAFDNAKGIYSGQWKWEIPWEFQVEKRKRPTRFLTVTQFIETASNGDTSATKQGESKSAKINDPDADYK